MVFNYDLWKREFGQDDIPSLPCPACLKSVVVLDKSTFRIEEPAYSKKERQHEGWDPTWDVSRFMFFMRCAVPACGEIIAVSGTATTEIYTDDEYGMAAHAVLHPHSVRPAPYIINLPEDLPPMVENPLVEAFELFWPDLGSSANRLRVSVENLLDFFNVPRQSSNAAGKVSNLNLARRIDVFKGQNQVHAIALDALREVGNVGSHEGSVEWLVLLDAFVLYEATLAELIGKRTEILARIRDKIIQGKGKYNP